MSTSFFRRFHDIRIYAVLISIALSLWAIIYVDNVINDDGVIYLRSAALIREGSWHDALAVHPWPFYSGVIASVSYLTRLSPETAAHLVNMTFTAMLVVCFIELVREFGGDNKTVIAAAVVILLYPGINEYRADVIRGTGYTAFYLLSLLCFIRLIKKPRWQLVPGWVGGILLAGLFRVEGFAFLLAMPLIWWLVILKNARWQIGLGVLSAILLMIAMLVGLSLWLGAPIGTGDMTARWLEIWQIVGSNVGPKLTVIREQVLTRYSDDYAPIVLIVTLTLIVVHSVVDKLTPLFTVLTFHAVYRKLVFPVPHMTSIWACLIAVHIAILGTIVVARMFITSRWPTALSLTLMLAVPFSLVALHRRWQERQGMSLAKNWVFPVVCGLFFLTAIDGLTSFTNKTYLKEAGIWIKDNTSPQATLFSDSPPLIHYSGKDASLRNYFWDDIIEAIKDKERFHYNYLALRIKRGQRNHENEVRRALGQEPIKTFENNKGDKVIIFKVHENTEIHDSRATNVISRASAKGDPTV